MNERRGEGGAPEGGACPRVLIVNQQSMNRENATGITLRSLWAQWPDSKLMEIYLDGSGAHIRSDRTFSRFMPGWNAARKLASGKLGGRVNRSMKAGASDAAAPTLKGRLRQCAVCLIDAAAAGLNAKQRKMVDDFAPEVIYTLGASVAALRLAHRLAHRCNAPIVIHFMDNWPEYLQWEDNVLVRPYAAELRRQMRRCLAHSRNAIAVSLGMAKRYAEIFGLEFEVLMNCVDWEQTHCDAPAETDGKRHFVYAGGLHLDRWRALREIAAALEKQRGECVLDIYTNDRDRGMYEHCFSDVPARFHPPVPHEQMRGVLSAADVLVHAESRANPMLVRFFRYSVSTKIPEYLASGKPVLFYGPEEMGLYEYLKENDAAAVASREDELEAAIQMLFSEERCARLIGNAAKLARENHEAQRVRQKLETAIRRACR